MVPKVVQTFDLIFAQHSPANHNTEGGHAGQLERRAKYDVIYFRSNTPKLY